MESAFAVTTRKCTVIQREHLSKIASLLISSWKFLDLADEIAGIGAVSSSHEVTQQSESLFLAIKLGVHNLHSVCSQKIFSMLTSVLFEEFAFALLKVLLNLSHETRNDVQLVYDDGVSNQSLGDNLAGFAMKASRTNTSRSPLGFICDRLQVQAAGLALGSYAKKAAVMTFMGNTLAETLLSRSKASLTILNGIQEIFLAYQSKHGWVYSSRNRLQLSRSLANLGCEHGNGFEMDSE